MLNILEVSKEKLTTLNHGPNVFHAALNNIVLENRTSAKIGAMVSYLGTLRTDEYGSRIRMTAFHAMQEKGVMVQAIEVGGIFYINWYQGFHGELYAKAMRDIMMEAGMNSVAMERVE